MDDQGQARDFLRLWEDEHMNTEEYSMDQIFADGDEGTNVFNEQGIAENMPNVEEEEEMIYNDVVERSNAASKQIEIMPPLKKRKYGNSKGVVQNKPAETNLSSEIASLDESPGANAKRAINAERKRESRGKKKLEEQTEKDARDKHIKELEISCKSFEEDNKKLHTQSQRLIEALDKAKAEKESIQKKYEVMERKYEDQHKASFDLALQISNTNKNVYEGTDEILIRHMMDEAKKSPELQKVFASFRKEIDAKAKDCAQQLFLQGLFDKKKSNYA